jgi:hypothetical protein
MIVAEELLLVASGKRGGRLDQTNRQREDCRRVSAAANFQTRLLALPIGRHCKCDPILEDGSAWIMRTAQPPKLFMTGLFWAEITGFNHVAGDLLSRGYRVARSEKMDRSTFQIIPFGELGQ